MEYTGKTKMFNYQGRELRLLNQSCPEWTAYYGYPGIPREANDNLHDAGCGIFSVCHLIDWATGEKIDPDELADFSCRTGGRGDDGTDRPMYSRLRLTAEPVDRIGGCDAAKSTADSKNSIYQILRRYIPLKLPRRCAPKPEHILL